MRRIGAVALWLAFSPLVARAETPAACGSPAALEDGWPISSPQQEGLDPKLICAIGPRFEHWDEADAHGVVIVRHGVLVYEHYFSGGDAFAPGEVTGPVPRDATTTHNMASITKSVTALLTGIAFDRGWLNDLDAPVFPFFPQYADLRTAEKDHITVRHLLTMTSGLAWPESSLSYNNPANIMRHMGSSADPFRFVLAQPMAAAPGTVWNYNGGGVELLGVIVQKASGRLLDRLAKEALFDPLGITDWLAGTAYGGLQLRPRDLAKIGQLVLNRGIWHGRQIVSAAWVKEMTAAQSTPARPFSRGVTSYGYLWWLGRSSIEGRDIDWVGGRGWGGQRLYVVPSLDLVVAVTAGVYTRRGPPDLAGDAALDTYALPAALAR